MPDVGMCAARRSNDALLLSIRQYAEAMNISEGLARLQVKRGNVRHMRIGDRVMIPKTEPQRQIDLALEKIAQASPAE